MDTTELTRIVEQAFEDCRKLLTVKGGEYSSEGDRLANFKRGAELVGVKPLTVLLVYLSKHYDAVSTYVRDQQAGVTRERSELIEGRLQDLINYCLLAMALIAEDAGKPVDPRNPADLMMITEGGHTILLYSQVAEEELTRLEAAACGAQPYMYLGARILKFRPVRSGVWTHLP